MPLTRRRFLSLTTATALSFPLIGSRVFGANNTIRVALIGCGNRGSALFGMFQGIPGVEMVAICDPDLDCMAKLLKNIEKKQISSIPKADPENEEQQKAYRAAVDRAKTDVRRINCIQDHRKLLERKDIDAVVIASPNYWHTLHAIQAMQAGKDVYLEKPVSHSLWEGQQLVAAESKYNRIVQAGFQNRSDPGPREGIKYATSGELGKILGVHVCCLNNRKSIGPVRTEPWAAEANLDYNLWLGPASDVPITRNKLHYDWHWVWNTGNGDVGNQAPHEIDLACWTLGDAPLPTRIQSTGGRFAWNDAGETPNILTTWYEQAGIPVIIEVNNLCISPTVNAAPLRNGIRIGVVIKCEGGEVRGGRGGMDAVAEDGKTKLQSFKGDGGASHQRNFIDAVRSRKRDSLTSSLVDAEKSSAIAHLANLSFRSGSPSTEAELDKSIGGHAVIPTILQEQKAQLEGWGVERPEYTLGAPVQVDPATRVASCKGLELDWVHTPGRGEFVVPELG